MKNLIFLLTIISFYNCYSFWGKKEEPIFATEMHKLADCCDYAHAKCSYVDLFISKKIDPGTKDSNGLTARQIAEKKYKAAQTEWGVRHCKWVIEELEAYEEWYRSPNETSDDSL